MNDEQALPQPIGSESGLKPAQADFDPHWIFEKPAIHWGAVDFRHAFCPHWKMVSFTKSAHPLRRNGLRCVRLKARLSRSDILFGPIRTFPKSAYCGSNVGQTVCTAH